MQTILGSGGAIGIELAKSLKQFTSDIKLVSRNPKKINDTDILFPADLTDPAKVDEAIKGSEIVYITVGFPYNTKIWQSTWPNFIQSVVDACIKHNAKLVFFDNIYMYDPNYLDGMKEDTPIKPISKKGIVRAEVLNRITKEVESGNLKALIARSADFYGPSIVNTSMLTETVFTPLSKGKKANWPIALNYKHSFTYTPDAGKATALLGNTDDAYNQTWHLPTAKNPLNGKQWVTLISKEMKSKNKVSTVSNFMFKVIGLFVPVMREMPEMMYQYNRDYDFNSDKFTNRFPEFKVTTYEEGVKEVVAIDYKD
ncbi:NAD(P)H-binding protein [Paracrocinitomix mangrovi]|uniref:NAD(P)H-binding protein n=1 Tax=Paracrocinitomix mangrovi TaxID=2862509 RepID=UPI001C8D9E25|nr:NAD(P)H-binding protein [Paracrocinitomix mangrovi]UKN01909.1 NAD(P)H-binding protein [Paracrocinitomix mangrovi]